LRTWRWADVLTKAKLDAIRALHAEFEAGLRSEVVAGSYEEMRAFDIACSLIESVPRLVDEIERLRADRPEPSAATVYVKYDVRGGTA
jgi:hypothetical protein